MPALPAVAALMNLRRLILPMRFLEPVRRSFACRRRNPPDYRDWPVLSQTGKRPLAGRAGDRSSRRYAFLLRAGLGVEAAYGSHVGTRKYRLVVPLPRRLDDDLEAPLRLAFGVAVEAHLQLWPIHPELLDVAERNR